MKKQSSGLIAGALVALITSLLLGPTQVYAVVKDFQVMSNGAPVKSTSVSLTSPSGKTYGGPGQEPIKTDEDGKVIGFNFDEKGEWRVDWEGGTMLLMQGGGGWQPYAVGGVLVATTALAIDAADGNNDDGNSSSGGGSSPISGSYSMSTSLISNPDSHPDNFPNCSYDVNESSGSLTIACSGTGIDVTLNGSLTMGEMFTATGIGTYQGFAGTEFQQSGTFDSMAGTWSGNIAAGTNGSLPDTDMSGTSEPIEVAFTGSQ
ncbi:MAG: hypothetical protein ACR2QB_08715 [Gammaproteobacteria bacterium]